MTFLEEFKVHVKGLLEKGACQSNKRGSFIRLLEPRINELQSLAIPLRSIQQALEEAGLDIDYNYFRTALHRARKPAKVSNGKASSKATQAEAPALGIGTVSAAAGPVNKGALQGKEFKF